MQAGSRLEDGRIVGIDVPAWDISGFYPAGATFSDTRLALGAANRRYFPFLLEGIRSQNLHLLDVGISKNHRFANGMRLQARIELLNAINTVVFSDPDLSPRSATFGLYRAQRNLPRDVQLGVKLTF